MTTPKSIDEVTAEWLDKRALEIAGTFDDNGSGEAFAAFYAATKLRLEQAVEVYRVVSGLFHAHGCDAERIDRILDEVPPQAIYLPCTCGRDALLTQLGQDIGLQQH